MGYYNKRSHRAIAAPRTLHMLDIENLVGGRTRQNTCADLWSAYGAAVGVDRDDQVVAAAAAPDAIWAFLAIPRNIHRLAPPAGADAADLALLDAWPVPEVVGRFERVVIASADHIFAGYARRLRLCGIRVDQATGRGMCSAELYRVCQHRYVLFGSAPQIAA